MFIFNNPLVIFNVARAETKEILASHTRSSYVIRITWIWANHNGGLFTNRYLLSTLNLLSILITLLTAMRKRLTKATKENHSVLAHSWRYTSWLEGAATGVGDDWLHCIWSSRYWLLAVTLLYGTSLFYLEPCFTPIQRIPYLSANSLWKCTHSHMHTKTCLPDSLGNLQSNQLPNKINYPTEMASHVKYWVGGAMWYIKNGYFYERHHVISHVTKFQLRERLLTRKASTLSTPPLQHDFQPHTHLSGVCLGL